MSLYEVLKASKTERFPDYWTLLWARKLSASMIKTLTGTVPLTFRTSETALRSWTIYGNNTQHNYNAEGTLPLTFTTAKAGAASDWDLEGNDNVGKNILENTGNTIERYGVTFTKNADGTVLVNGTSTSNACIFYVGNVTLEPDKTYIYNGCPAGGGDRTTYCLYFGGKDADWADFGEGKTLPAVTESTTLSSRIVVYKDTTVENLVFKPMLRPANTSPEFEPHTVGVGQRTKNLFDESDFSLIKVTPTAYRYGTIIGILPQGTYTLTATKAESAQYVYLTKKNNGTYTYEEITNVPYTFTADGVSQYILRIADQNEYDSWAQFGYSKIMLVEGSTAPATYIPYGYEVPLTISQTGQPDKTVDIYIGDSPLTAGQSISKTSTGVDIAAIAGSNTITTDIYNKPSMSIEGVDYVGVGMVSGDKYLIRVICSADISPYNPNAPESDTNYVYNDSTYTLDTDSRYKTALISWQGGNGSFTITKTKGSTFKLEGLNFMGNWGGEDHYIRTTVITPTGISYTGSTEGTHLLITYYDSEVDTLTPREIRESITVSASVTSMLGLPLLDAPLTEGETLTMESVGHDFTTFAGVENTIEPLNPEIYDYGDFEMSITYKGG